MDEMEFTEAELKAKQLTTSDLNQLFEQTNHTKKRSNKTINQVATKLIQTETRAKQIGPKSKPKRTKSIEMRGSCRSSPVLSNILFASNVITRALQTIYPHD